MLFGTKHGERVRRLLEDDQAVVHIPTLCDVEVASGLRGALLRGALSVERARGALTDYLDLHLVRHGHQLLMLRALELRTSFSVYDAVYVALSEQLGATFVTADERLGIATRGHTDLAVLT